MTALLAASAEALKIGLFKYLLLSIISTLVTVPSRLVLINKNYGIKFIEEILTKEELTKLDQYIKSQKFKSATYDF